MSPGERAKPNSNRIPDGTVSSGFHAFNLLNIT
jgi:hypothetical protein